VDAVKVKPSVFLLDSDEKGIWPKKNFVPKSPVRKVKGGNRLTPLVLGLVQHGQET